MSKVKAIFAISRDYVIGKGNGLPWHIPEDLKRFKELTENSVVIMGRNTYDSLPDKFRPLPNRINIIVSSFRVYEEGAICVSSFLEALRIAKVITKTTKTDICIIGGSTIYRQAEGHVDEYHITYIDEDFDDDSPDIVKYVCPELINMLNSSNSEYQYDSKTRYDIFFSKIVMEEKLNDS